MRVFYLPQSSTSLSTEALRESMRRWHWHRYFVALRAKNQDLALYHSKLAKSIQRMKKSGGLQTDGLEPRPPRERRSPRKNI
jgi:hypothetical protein